MNSDPVRAKRASSSASRGADGLPALPAWANRDAAALFQRVAAFIEQDLTSELDLILENLPTTGTLKFYVQATNPAGDSPKSEVAEVSLS